ncbi:MAG: hypothetical protein AAGG75_15955 [Bacteroidota bacterium]
MKVPTMNDRSYKNLLLIFFFLLLFLFSLQLSAQPSKWKGPTRVWVTYKDGTKKKGWMHDVRDSSILFVKKHSVTYHAQRYIENRSFIRLRDNELTEALAKDIDHIKLKRKHAIYRGALIGAGIGLGLGIMTGLIDGDDKEGWFALTKEQKAVGFGIAFAVPGAVIGGVIGAFRIRIPLGSQTAYRKGKRRITRHMVRP